MQELKNLADILLECVTLLKSDPISSTDIDKIINRLKFVLCELTNRKA